MEFSFLIYHIYTLHAFDWARRLASATDADAACCRAAGADRHKERQPVTACANFLFTVFTYMSYTAVWPGLSLLLKTLTLFDATPAMGDTTTSHPGRCCRHIINDNILSPEHFEMPVFKETHPA
eukprot:g56974.t1